MSLKQPCMSHRFKLTDQHRKTCAATFAVETAKIDFAIKSVSLIFRIDVSGECTKELLHQFRKGNGFTLETLDSQAKQVIESMRFIIDEVTSSEMTFSYNANETLKLYVDIKYSNVDFIHINKD